MDDLTGIRYLVLAASPMPSISYKFAIFKMFGRYPKDDECRFVVEPKVPDPESMYIIDVLALLEIDTPEDLGLYAAADDPTRDWLG